MGNNQKKLHPIFKNLFNSLGLSPDPQEEYIGEPDYQQDKQLEEFEEHRRQWEDECNDTKPEYHPNDDEDINPDDYQDFLNSCDDDLGSPFEHIMMSNRQFDKYMNAMESYFHGGC